MLKERIITIPNDTVLIVRQPDGSIAHIEAKDEAELPGIVEKLEKAGGVVLKASTRGDLENALSKYDRSRAYDDEIDANLRR